LSAACSSCRRLALLDIFSPFSYMLNILVSKIFLEVTHEA
jgi:hypothetical protein